MGPKAAAPVAMSGKSKEGAYYNLTPNGPILDSGMDLTPMETPAWVTDDAPEQFAGESGEARREYRQPDRDKYERFASADDIAPNARLDAAGSIYPVLKSGRVLGLPSGNGNFVDVIDGLVESVDDSKLIDISARRSQVISGGGGNFKISSSHQADGRAPIFEIDEFNSVNEYSGKIDAASKRWGVDADLIRSVMYMEQTHGYYDVILQPFDRNHTILPMNVHDTLWGDFVGSREQLMNPEYNINAGAKILAGIKANLAPADRGVAKIATLYNKLSATEVTDYGARVYDIYKNKPWNK